MLGGALCSLFLLASSAKAQTMVVRSGTTQATSTSTTVENTNIVSQNYNGSTYTFTGTNVQSNTGNIGLDVTYSPIVQGAPTQMSETYFEGGLVNITTTGTNKTTTTNTTSLSVFAEATQ